MAEPTPTSIQRKTCSKCGESKPLSEFGSRGKGRLSADCKPCVAQASRERYQRDPQVRARHKVLRDRWRADNPAYLQEYYRRNREKHLAYVAKYVRENPPDPVRKRELKRARRAADPERFQEKDRAWRAANRELVREATRRGQSRRRALLRTLPSDSYTIGQLLERDGTLCVLCDGELDMTVGWPEPLAPSVEHLECLSWPESPGDVLSNVAVSHWDCNNRRKNKPHPAAARKRAELLAAQRT